MLFYPAYLIGKGLLDCRQKPFADNASVVEGNRQAAVENFLLLK